MNKLLYTLGLAGMTAVALPVIAQEKGANKLGEYDEIILKRKDGKDGKVTVEIKDGEVYVDGKKISEYKGEDISVYHRRNTPVDGNTFSFRGAPRGGMQLYRGEGAPEAPSLAGKAVLGVITAKEEAAGATVKEVSEGSAAEKAGLKEGDVITQVNDAKISEPQELFEAIAAKKPGEEVTVTYLRNKKESKAKAKLGERPAAPLNFGGDDGNTFNFRSMPRGGDDNTFDFRRMPRGGDLEDFFGGMQRQREDNSTRLGLSVQDTEDGKGVKVLDVTEGSAAEKAGFKEEDVITELGGSAVRSARDVVSTYQANKAKGELNAKILRGGKVQTLTVKVPKKLNKADL
ncbi:PDZ domain-containing protein [Chitinophaga horti]|uniref:PDZ domain-containing protein n=1 Tax=Chitinophaga horti TaxID=2920382 RepID=A0ABY6J106_9BACT|nr:PDZ domain-containing protein [Chitinophaga horti]UYQ93091.1 PDZ domain-containing protein [Chitinophaga horti]